ncbi:hypothetical protein D3C71_1820690 [compost metagenome]
MNDSAQPVRNSSQPARMIGTPKCSLQYRRTSSMSPISVLLAIRSYIANHNAF